MISDAAFIPDSLAMGSEVCDRAIEPAANQARAVPQLVGEPSANRICNPVDEALLEQLRNGARDALGTLFRRYAGTVRNIAWRILRDEAEAEDLVQEVFLFAFRRASLFDPARGSARSWLMQIAYHRAFDRRRHLVARHFYSNLELEEALLGSEEPAACASSYDDTLEAAVGRDALARIEESLTADQREVLRLHFVDGYTVQEIAGRTGHSVASVRNHYYRALERIRREVFGTDRPRR